MFLKLKIEKLIDEKVAKMTMSNTVGPLLVDKSGKWILLVSKHCFWVLLNKLLLLIINHKRTPHVNGHQVVVPRMSAFNCIERCCMHIFWKDVEMYGEIVKLIERSEEQRTTKDLRWSKASGGRSKRILWLCSCIWQYFIYIYYTVFYIHVTDIFKLHI